MFYQPDLFFYVLLLPVFGFIIIPSLWAMFAVAYRQVERSRLADVRGFLEIQPDSMSLDGGIERREEPRITIEGPKAVVGCRAKCCRTHVANISTKGIRLNGIPKKMFQKENDQFELVFRTREHDYSMLVQPKWKDSGEKCYMIGAEIVDRPEGWEEFVSGFAQPVAAAA